MVYIWGLRKHMFSMLSTSRSIHHDSTRTYANAIEALNTLQSNAASIEAIRKLGRGMNKQAIPEMLEWLRRIGYQAKDFDPLNAIHIAGTKGKGSTAAFVSSILNQYRDSEYKELVGQVGLYTSPHLRFVRERIQINGEPISEEAFAKSFFEVWDRLEQSHITEPVPEGQATKPVYFRFLTMMALHTYLTARVDAAVIECGMGGEYDSTNVLLRPVAAGITSLGIDHVSMLGSTIDSIAWHKAGIMKPGVPTFTAPQPQEALDVLFSRAQERATSVQVVDIHPEIANGEIQLGLNGEFQKLNASLAIELAAQYLRARGKFDIDTTKLPEEFRAGLTCVHWPGRCQVKEEQNLTWYIDGAHTMESIKATGQWYREVIPENDDTMSVSRPRILLFNQQTRVGSPLLAELQQTLKCKTSSKPSFTHAIFCSNITFASSGYRPDLISINADSNIVQGLHVQSELAKAWQDLDPLSNVSISPTIEDAVKQCQEIAVLWQLHNPSAAGKPSVLATGSIHLIGGLLEVLEEGPESA